MSAIAHKKRVLLLGNYRPTLTLARQLSARHYCVVSGLEGCDHGAEFSSYVDETWDHPLVSEKDDKFLRSLEQFIDQNQIDFIYPVLEEYVRFFAERQLSKVGDARVCSPAPSTVLACLDKEKMFALAHELGVPTAPSETVKNFQQMKLKAAHIGFPLVVRPQESTHRISSAKALIVHNPDALKLNFGSWPEGHDGFIMQRHAQGARHNIYFAAFNGRITQQVQTQISATDKRDGTGLAIRGKTVDTNPILLKHSAQFVQHLNYSGVGCAQYLMDERTNKICFLEINPRIVGSHAIAEHAGLNLSEFPIQVASESAQKVGNLSGKVGLSYVWTCGALQAIKHELHTRQIGPFTAIRMLGQAMLASCLADSHMVFDPKDPKPAFAALFQLLPSRIRNWQSGATDRNTTPTPNWKKAN